MKNLIQELEKLLQTGNFPKEITEQYLQRIKKGKLSITENSLSHFCVSTGKRHWVLFGIQTTVF